MFGNDLATQPDFPAEIRAPAGTIAGVSAFQVHISDHDIVTPGDTPNVLVAMNPAALKANVSDLVPGSTLLINVDTFEQRNLDKAGYAQNPLHDDSLAAYRVYEVPMTSITVEATKPLGVKPRDAERSKNFFALGPDLLDVHAPDRSAGRLDQEALREPARGVRGERRRVPRRVQLRRDRRAVRPRVRGQARAACRRASTARSPATSRCRTGSSRPRRRRSCRCSTRRTRSRPPPTSCTSSRS